MAALVLGVLLSKVQVSTHAPVHRLLFQGTEDDARNLLIGIVGSVITIIALVLGLTLVALQVSSTQYSPRVLRNFLRDRPNQVFLSVIVATFAYSAGGLWHGSARSPGQRPWNRVRPPVLQLLSALPPAEGGGAAALSPEDWPCGLRRGIDRSGRQA